MILVACAFLVAVFFIPIWHIELIAPQYPAGLDMYIWINKITGTDEFTLQNINILNHYIGMQAIFPDSFKELIIMPYVVVFFVVMGIIAVLTNNKKVAVAWLAILIIGGTIGLVDFYMWQQAFGNNLDPAAPIKVEGMSYSPPFLGEKTLLNIKATSYPDWGGIFFGVALLLAIVALIYDKLKAIRIEKSTARTYKTAVAASLFVLLASCKPEAQAIEYGFDACSHCKMTIADNRFGAELVTEKAKVFKFDAIECLVEFQKSAEEKFAMNLVTNFAQPGNFIDAQQAFFLQSESIPSPMGMNLSAFLTQTEAEEVMKNSGGELMNWTEVTELRIGGH